MHIRPKVSKTNRMLGFIKRTLGMNAPVRCKKIVYNAFVRSSLMYASRTWYPNKDEMKLIASVQRRATKYILCDYVSDYTTRLFRSCLLPLSFVREINDLFYFYKCFYGLYNVDISDTIPLPYWRFWDYNASSS